MRRVRMFGLAFALITPLVLGCNDAAGLVGAPGMLTATLASPSGAEGAALFHMVGGQISSVGPLAGHLHTSAG